MNGFLQIFTGRIRRPILIAIAASGALSIPGSAASTKLSKDLGQASSAQQIDVIIQFAGTPSNAVLASIQRAGGIQKALFHHMNGGLFTVPANALTGIAANPQITYISPDRKVSGTLEFAEPTVNANIALQYGWDGQGVGVAIIDSGMYIHPDYKSRVVYSESFVAGSTTTSDAFGHGTHVAGVVGGDGSSSTGPNYLHTFRGIAPHASLINLRALDNTGTGTDSAVISAVERAIDLKSNLNIRVINLSLGRTVFESYTQDPLCQELERAWKAGLVVVVAAGNNGRDDSMGTSGYSTITSPANDPLVITVGAMKDMGTVVRGDDLISSYSSKGPTLLDQVVKPDLVAPGNNIVSALSPGSSIVSLYPANVVPVSYYKGSSTTNVSSVYFRLSGTSIAAPMVSGAAALLLQQRASLTPD